jgi:hypothetical protein
VDESGCTGTILTKTSQVQPIFLVSGILVKESLMAELTMDYLYLKESYYPNKKKGLMEFLNWIQVEIKGCDVRSQLRHRNRDERRHGIGFLDRIFDLFEKYEIQIIGKLYVKNIGVNNDSVSMYTASVQSLCNSFQNFLISKEEQGVMILDARQKGQNQQVSHSIFTKKFKMSGDSYRNMSEMPVFGHSNNHAGIQLADFLCSAVLFPLASHVYCTGFIKNVHVNPKYGILKTKYGERLKKLQYRYQDEQDKWRGGITVCDNLKKRRGNILFND